MPEIKEPPAWEEQGANGKAKQDFRMIPRSVSRSKPFVTSSWIAYQAAMLSAFLRRGGDPALWFHSKGFSREERAQILKACREHKAEPRIDPLSVVAKRELQAAIEALS